MDTRTIIALVGAAILGIIAFLISQLLKRFVANLPPSPLIVQFPDGRRVEIAPTKDREELERRIRQVCEEDAMVQADTTKPTPVKSP